MYIGCIKNEENVIIDWKKHLKEQKTLEEALYYIFEIHWKRVLFQISFDFYYIRIILYMSRYSILYNNETRCNQDVGIPNNHKPYSCFLNIDVTIF